MVFLRETHRFSTLRAFFTLLIPVIVITTPIALWQFGIFSTPITKTGGGSDIEGYGGSVILGFNRIKVLLPSMNYSGDTLTFDIINAAGDLISVKTINVSGSGCDSVEGIPSMLAAGDTATLTVKCDEKKRGDSFSVTVKIEYYTKVGREKIQNFEIGTIRGTVE